MTCALPRLYPRDDDTEDTGCGICTITGYAIEGRAPAKPGDWYRAKYPPVIHPPVAVDFQILPMACARFDRHGIDWLSERDIDCLFDF